MRKKIVSWVLLVFLMLMIGGVASADSSPIRIIQNGQEVIFQEGEGNVVVDENNRTLVPVRKVAELLGAAVDWHPETQTASVNKGDITLLIKIGDEAIRSGQKVILMDTSAKIIGDRTYLPLRAISENLGYRILWDAEARTIGFEPARTLLSQMEAPVAGDTVALMKTSMGEIRIKLLKEDAPKAVENFIGLAKKGYYDNLTFHRVIQDFMIQGGDPNGNGTGGQSIWGKPFEDEFSDTALNYRGALSMANSGPSTNGSQFFIVQKEGGTPWLNGKHTVFGQVYAGMDVVDKISAVETGMGDSPVNPVTILSITIETLN